MELILLLKKMERKGTLAAKLHVCSIFSRGENLASYANTHSSFLIQKWNGYRRRESAIGRFFLGGLIFFPVSKMEH